jgi:hypothetical protein
MEWSNISEANPKDWDNASTFQLHRGILTHGKWLWSLLVLFMLNNRTQVGLKKLHLVDLHILIFLMFMLNIIRRP